MSSHIRYTEDEIKAIGKKIAHTTGHPRLENYHLKRLLLQGYDTYMAETEAGIKKTIATYEQEGKGKTLTPYVYFNEVLPLIMHPDVNLADIERINALIWSNQPNPPKKYGSGIYSNNSVLESEQALNLVKLGVLREIESPQLLDLAMELGLPPMLYHAIGTNLRADLFVPKAIDALKAGHLDKYNKTSFLDDPDYRFAQSWLGCVLGDSKGIEASGQKEVLMDTFLDAVKTTQNLNNGLIPLGTWDLFEPFYRDSFSDPNGPYSDILLDRNSQHPVMDLVTQSGDMMLAVLAARAASEGTLLAEHEDDRALLDATVERVRNDFIKKKLYNAYPNYYNYGSHSNVMRMHCYGINYRDDLYTKLTGRDNNEIKEKFTEVGAAWTALPWSKPAFLHLIENQITPIIKGSISKDQFAYAALIQAKVGNPDLAWELIDLHKEKSIPMSICLMIVEETPMELMSKYSEIITRKVVVQKYKNLLSMIKLETANALSDQQIFDRNYSYYGSNYFNPDHRPSSEYNAIINRIANIKGPKKLQPYDEAEAFIKAFKVVDFEANASLPDNPDEVIRLIMQSLSQPNHKIEETIVSVQIAKEGLIGGKPSQEVLVKPAEDLLVKKKGENIKLQQEFNF